jgi:hypothetical protein
MKMQYNAYANLVTNVQHSTSASTTSSTMCATNPTTPASITVATDATALNTNQHPACSLGTQVAPKQQSAAQADRLCTGTSSAAASPCTKLLANFTLCGAPAAAPNAAEGTALASLAADSGDPAATSPSIAALRARFQLPAAIMA